MKKVLLIGLGGTGCAVASKVQRMVNEAELRHGKNNSIIIRFLGFDTDDNQDDAPNLNVVKTSRDSSVYNLLQGEKKHEEWFPSHPMLLARNMMNGAGQIRVLSRLAFSDTMRNPDALVGLREVLRELNSENGQPSDGLKIMIVSSFAGGTGSGMFLQMPLFLRSYIEKEFPGTQVIIRGLFALPDVFMGHRLNKIQRESMYANAYASLKELAAVSRICVSSNPSLLQYDIKIGDLFDSKKILEDEKSDSPHRRPRAGRKPYDFIFFMDNINLNRNMLTGTKNVYEEEMAKITYMQVYAPLENTTDSREDNLILTSMQSEGEAMYGSAGSAKLIYPYEDILQYFACRTVDDIVKNQWRKIDEYYRALVANLKNKQKVDRTIKIPSLQEVFVEQVEKLIKEKNPYFSFFAQDVLEIRNSDDGSNIPVEVNRTEEFMEKITRYLNASYQGDAILADIKSSTKLKIDYLKTCRDSSEVINAVRKREMEMGKYNSTIDSRIPMKALSIADSIIPAELNGDDDDQKKEYNIRNLLEKLTDKGRHAVHPLSARYLLYSLLKLVTDARKAAERSVTASSSTIEQYWNEDHDENTDGVIEKWYDVVPEKFRTRRDWIDEYDQASSEQLAELDKYGTALLTKEVLTLLSEKLSGLIQRYEKVFGLLDVVSGDLKNKMDLITQKYQSDGVSEIYLCSSPEYLDAVYSDLTLGDNSEEEYDIFDTMFSMIYRDAMAEMNQKAHNRFYTGKTSSQFQERFLGASVKGMFADKIVAHYKKLLRQNCNDELNLNVFEALERQAAMDIQQKALNEGTLIADETAAISARHREILAQVYRKAAPYLLCTEYHEADPENASDSGATDAQPSFYWGVSREVFDNIKNTYGDVDRYLTPAKAFAPETNASTMYSEYELCCYRAIYSVRLTEIPKFQESDDPEYQGEFYKNYAARIEKMQQGRYGKTDEGITPHLDRRWHTRQYLPMLSGAKDSTDDKKAAKAMWLAYLTDNIHKNSRKNGLEIWFMQPRKTRGKDMMAKPRPLHCDGEPVVKMENIYGVFKAFQQDTFSVDQMLDTLEPVLDRNASELLSSVTFNLTGPNGILLPKALIGYSGEEVKLLDLDQKSSEEDDASIETSGFNTNALTMMYYVLRDKLAEDDDKEVIMSALWEIIDKLGENMGDRYDEFLLRIFMNSPFTNKRNRNELAERMIIQPYFYDVADRYDNYYASSVKKAPAKVAPAKKATGKKAPAKAVTTKKTTAKKAPAKAAAAKKTTTKKAPAKKASAKKGTH